jgi:hypothetical protein
MRNVIFRQIIILLVIGAILGIAFYLVYHSKEFRAGYSIAEKYAAQKQLPSDLTCLSADRSWTKRGDYNLSCFVFLPKNEFNSTNLINNYNSAHLIFVRYTDKCPLNTFEVGTTTNSNARNCLTNTAINDANFINPP